MRFCLCSTLLVLSAVGVAAAQDTNFANGPQYLMNYGSAYYARPISTPSLSLSGPALEVGANNATAGLIAGAQTQIAPPRLAVALPQVDLFPIYYGDRPTNVIEISFSESLPGGLPASIFNTGTWQMTTAQALRERGIGVTVAEAAAYEKARAGHATHVYTNADIDRLHKSS
jgi:hypothetical protein